MSPLSLTVDYVYSQTPQVSFQFNSQQIVYIIIIEGYFHCLYCLTHTAFVLFVCVLFWLALASDMSSLLYIQ